MVFDYNDKKTTQDVFVNSVSLENVARSEFSDDRAQSVQSIHSEDMETATLQSTPTTEMMPSFDELEQRLERSQRNMAHIQKQREQLLRLTDSFKDQLSLIEKTEAQPENFDDLNFESVEKMNSKISTLTSRLQSLSHMISKQRELESQLNSQSFDIDEEGEQELAHIGKKLETKTVKNVPIDITKYKPKSVSKEEKEKSFDAQEKQMSHLKEAILEKNNKLDSLSKKIDALKNMATMASQQYKNESSPREISIPVQIEKPKNVSTREAESKENSRDVPATSLRSTLQTQHLTSMGLAENTLGLERNISSDQNNFSRHLTPQVFSSMETLSTALTNSNKLVFMLSKELETAYATIDALQARLAASFKTPQVSATRFIGDLDDSAYRRIQQEDEHKQEYRAYQTRQRHEVLNKSYKTNDSSLNK